MNLTANVNEGYLSSSEEHPTITYLTEEKTIETLKHQIMFKMRASSIRALGNNGHRTNLFYQLICLIKSCAVS